MNKSQVVRSASFTVAAYQQGGIDPAALAPVSNLTDARLQTVLDKRDALCKRRVFRQKLINLILPVLPAFNVVAIILYVAKRRLITIGQAVWNWLIPWESTTIKSHEHDYRSKLNKWRDRF